MLENLATLCPYKDGNAVFIAQNILNAIDEEFVDYSHNCDDITFRKRKQVLVDNSLTMSKIYPNPASDIVYCDYVLEHNAHAELIIKDFNGKFVLRTSLDNKRQQIIVDLHSLSAGAYIIEIQNTTGEVNRHKLNIIK